MENKKPLQLQFTRLLTAKPPTPATGFLVSGFAAHLCRLSVFVKTVAWTWTDSHEVVGRKCVCVCERERERDRERQRGARETGLH